MGQGLASLEVGVIVQSKKRKISRVERGRKERIYISILLLRIINFLSRKEGKDRVLYV